MIKHLEDGTTLVTLGNGTLFHGLANVGGSPHPIGICFTNEKGENLKGNDGTVVIQIENIEGVASYIMALVRLIETWDDDKTSSLNQILNDLKKDLERYLPKEKAI